MGHRQVKIKELLGLPWFELREELKAFDRLGLACVYAVGPEQEGQPIQINWTSSPPERFSQLRTANPYKLTAHRAVWVAGPPLAKRLLAGIHDIVERAGRRLQGDWFAADRAAVSAAFDQALATSGVPALTHGGMLAQVRAEHERKTTSLVLDAWGARPGFA